MSVEQACLRPACACPHADRRCPAPGQLDGFFGGGLFLQVGEDLLDHHRIFDAGDDLDDAAAFTAGLDVDVEHPLGSLRLRLIDARRSAGVGSCPFSQIDSILSQTYTDFRLIVLDDCSSDRSVEIVSDYLRRDARIGLYRNEKNIGVITLVQNRFHESRSWTAYSGERGRIGWPEIALLKINQIEPSKARLSLVLDGSAAL